MNKWKESNPFVDTKSVNGKTTDEEIIKYYNEMCDNIASREKKVTEILRLCKQREQERLKEKKDKIIKILNGEAYDNLDEDGYTLKEGQIVVDFKKMIKRVCEVFENE